MYTTTIKDEQGNEYQTTQSHASTKAAIEAIARAKIALYNLKDTPAEYIRKCEQKQASKSEAGQGLLIALVALAVVVVAVVLILGPVLTETWARLQANLGPLGQ